MRRSARYCEWPECERRGAQVKDVRVDLDGGFLEVGLCREHRQPVIDFIGKFPKHKFVKITSSHPRSRATSFRVTTMEEIERMKRDR